MHKSALIFGITGQDGSYLAELLIEKGYKVIGVIRRCSTFNTGRLYKVRHHENLSLEYGDVSDLANVLDILNKYKPDEIYNLAAMSHVKISYSLEKYTVDTDAVGTLNILQGIRLFGLNSRFYQASTSELFGNTLRDTKCGMLTLESPLSPVSPYAAAKLYAYHMVKIYREGYGIWATQGILFNHESPRRGENFVTQKIATWAKTCDHDNFTPLHIGNLDSKRDWSHAKDMVRGMWLILQQEKPADYVLASGEQHSVREFIELCVEWKGFKVTWEGSGINEKGYINDKLAVVVDERYFRPIDVVDLLGDPTHAKKELGWTQEISFKELVHDMMANDK